MNLHTIVKESVFEWSEERYKRQFEHGLATRQVIPLDQECYAYGGMHYCMRAWDVGHNSHDNTRCSCTHGHCAKPLTGPEGDVYRTGRREGRRP